MNISFTSLVALICVLLEGAARACPSCLGREDNFSAWQWVVGTLVLSPLVCAAVVARAIVARIKTERELGAAGSSSRWCAEQLLELLPPEGLLQEALDRQLVDEVDRPVEAGDEDSARR